jgi:predicted GNAT family N-acyltransferase
MPTKRPRVTFAAKPFARLTRMEVHDLFRLRTEVFVVGQKITIESEIDGHDPECTHVLGRDAKGRMVATARLFLGKDPVKVGRVAVATDLQRNGLGTDLMEFVHTLLPGRRAAMSAQAHLVPWYSRLGWTPVGAIYEEARIPHQRLERTFPTAPRAPRARRQASSRSSGSGGRGSGRTPSR